MPDIGKSDAKTKKVILAVDNIIVDLRTVRNALDKFYEVKVVKSSGQALLVLASSKVDLILLDIEMPGMSGFDVLEMIKKIPSIRNILVIFVSSHVSVELISQALKHGAVDYVVKPFDPGLLRGIFFEVRILRRKNFVRG
ncbi:MAG: response regulator [Treponema sp.]|jgi:putative two-component system response regulator|nr:response regulator [Treponema sp.]